MSAVYAADRVGHLVAAIALTTSDEEDHAAQGFIDALTEDEAKDAFGIAVGLLAGVFELEAMEEGVPLSTVLQSLSVDLATLCEAEL